MTRLKQLENYPTGDCVRTVMACLLDKECPEDVPNFMRDKKGKFNKHFTKWLEEEGLVWIEVSWEEFCKSVYMPIGLCGVSGKSPRGDWNHMIIGESGFNEDGKKRKITYLHDPSPHHDGEFLIGTPTDIGFLLKRP